MSLDSFILGWFKRNADLGSVVHLKYNESWNSIKDGIDYNLYFGKTAMSMTMMGIIMVGSILLLTGTFVAINMSIKQKGK